MTKQLKKGLLTILLFVMSICCAFSVNSFNTAKADNAVDPFEKLNTYVAAFEAVDETEWLKNDLWDDYANLLIEYDNLSAEQKETLTNKDTVDAVIAAYKAADEVVVSIEALGNFAIQSYTAGLARYNAVFGAYSALNDAEKAYVENNRLYNNLAEFKSDIDELKIGLDKIVELIYAIEYRENDQFVEDGVYAPATSEIVLKSFDSINAVTTALYGDAEDATDDIPTVDYTYITNLDNYKTALKEYNDLLDEIDAVETLIANLKIRVDAEGVYTVGFYPVGSDSDIVLARKAFAALDDTADINNLQAEVENIAVLEGIEAAFEGVKGEIDKVVLLIDAIPEVSNVRLIKAHLDLIVAAEEAFAALPEDVKTNDVSNYALATPVVENYMVSNYAKMCEARARYNDLDMALNIYVEKLVAYDVAYKAAEAEHVLISDEAVKDLEFLRKYSYALNQDQIDTLEAKKFNDTADTWFDVYKMYTQDYSTNRENVNIFSNNVNALVYDYDHEGIVVVVVDDKNRIEDLITTYVDELNALEKNWAQEAYLLLDNEDTEALGLKQRFAKDTKAITDWVAEVDKINAKVSVADFEQIKSVDATFKAWGTGSALQKVAMGGTYKVAYDKYQTALDEKAEIEGLIKTLTSKVKVVADRIFMDYTFDVNGFAKFEQRVNDMKAAKAALDAKDATAYESNYVDAKIRNIYDSKLVELEIFDVEITIKNLNNIANAHIVNLHIQVRMILEDIADINAQIEGLTDGYEPKSFRNLDVLNAAIADVNTAIDDIVAWKAAVEAIVAETVKTYDVYTVKALADATATYDSFEGYHKAYDYEGVVVLNITELKDLPEMSVAAVKAALDAKQKASDDAVAALVKEMDELLAVAEGELNTIETRMKDAQVAYKAFVEAGHDMASLVDYAAFEAKLARLDFAKYFAQAVADIAERADAEIYTAEDALMVDVLKAVYIASAGDLQKLDDVEDAKAKLDELEKVYAEKDLITIEGLDNAIDALANAIDALDGAYATDKELSDKAKEIYDKYDAIVDDFTEQISGILTDIGVNAAAIAKINDEVIPALNKDIDDINVAIGDLKVELENYVDDEIEKVLGELAKLAGENNTATVAGNAAAIAANKTAIEGAIDRIEALEAAVAALDNTYATDAELAGVKTALEGALATAVETLEAADAALAQAIAKEKADREAADADIKADLKAAVAKLNKTITIITILLAIVSAACVGAIVYIFLKKRA